MYNRKIWNIVESGIEHHKQTRKISKHCLNKKVETLYFSIHINVYYYEIEYVET